MKKKKTGLVSWRGLDVKGQRGFMTITPYWVSLGFGLVLSLRVCLLDKLSANLGFQLC